MRTIEIVIDAKGQTTIQTKGFAGVSCRDATRTIEKALGLVQSDVATPEMYQPAAVDQKLQQGNG